VFALVLAVGVAGHAAAQGELFVFPPAVGQAEMAVTSEMRRQAIEGTLARLRAGYVFPGYVFPEVAERMERAVRERLATGRYERISSARQLAAALTEDLRAVSHDGHLTIWYSYPDMPKDFGEEGKPDPVLAERWRRESAAQNYGFRRVERLSGNIGYLDLGGFFAPAEAGRTAAATMELLADTDALIIDLRRNGGGDPEMVALLCSYFFTAEPAVHLNDIVNPSEKRTRQFWTQPALAARRYLERPVYLLTSRRTFSAAEEFAYNLKALKRATIVGETTGGGAHPTMVRRVSDHFLVDVPSERSVNAVTGTNWEGTGVSPHVATDAERAFETAQRLALQAVLGSRTQTVSVEEARKALAKLK
jgi:hypothetical protein